MKKHLRILTFSAAMLSSLALAACGNGGGSIPSDPSVGPQPVPSSSSESSSSDSWEERAKRAMSNFEEKLFDGQYNVASEILTTNVVSNNLIFFDYDGVHGNDFAAMSVGNETFQSRVDMGEIKGVMFIDKGLAVKVGEQNLPNYWFNEAELGKDIWDMFEMVAPNDDKLHFKVKDQDRTIATSLGAFLGLQAMAVQGLSDISMEFDQEDVTTATLRARYVDGSSPVIQDVSATINLGSATTSPLAEQWMADPNRMMPSDLGPVGKWSNGPLMAIDTSLMLHDSDEAGAYVPFADFMSYAVWTNINTISTDQCAIIRDYHGTIKNVEDYKELLLAQEFTLKTTPAGEPYYTKILRAKGDHGVYVNVEVDYDHGFTLKVYRDVEVYKFNTRNDLNALIDGKGFPAFPETEAVYGWFGEDDYLIQTENWSYFYNFTCYPVVILKYTDEDDAIAYLEEYGKAVEALGFKRGTTSSSLTTWDYIDETVELEFKYNLDKFGNLQVILKHEDLADPLVMKATVEAAGYPTVDLTTAELVATRDQVKFQYFYYSMKCDAAYRNTFYFEDNDTAKQFLADYEKAIRDAGFIKKDKYYTKDNLIFEPNDASGGMVGLYFYITEQE